MGRLIGMFICLYFSINKNIFFEKYKFIKISDNKKNSFYIIWFIIKNYLTIMLGLVVLYRLFQNKLLCEILIIGLLLSELIRIDSNDWRLFERNDFAIAIPQAFERSMIVLLGNIMYKLMINTNLILYTVLLCFFEREHTVKVVIAASIYFLVFCISEWSVFFIRYSSLEIKKIYSFIGYIKSFIFNAAVFYLFFEMAIFFIKLVIKRDISKVRIMEELLIIVHKIMGLLSDYFTIILAAIIVITVVNLVVYVLALKRINENYYIYKDESRYIIKNFFILRLFLAIAKKIGRSSVLVEKEFFLFADIYKYNYANAWYVYLADRSIAILLAIVAVMYRHSFLGAGFVLMGLIPCFFILDISSAVSVKLIANMSLIADRNTVMIANTNGIDIKNILKSKLEFFYIIKSFNIIIYFAISNIIMNIFNGNIYMMLGVNLLNIMVLFMMPKNYLINNLIYTRMDYKDYRQFLDESQILDVGVNDFLPINILFKIISTVVMLILATFVLKSFIKFDIPAVIIYFLIVMSYLITIPVCSKVMKRIGRNIIDFIEAGNYSADFAKIFKK